MKYIYFNVYTTTAHICETACLGCGQLIGTVEELPPNVPFLLAALLTNAGLHDISGLAIVHGPPQPVTE